MNYKKQYLKYKKKYLDLKKFNLIIGGATSLELANQKHLDLRKIANEKLEVYNKIKTENLLINDTILKLSISKANDLLIKNNKFYIDNKSRFNPKDSNSIIQELHKLQVENYNIENLNLEDCLLGKCCSDGITTNINDCVNKPNWTDDMKRIGNHLWKGPIYDIPKTYKNYGLYSSNKKEIIIMQSVLSRLGEIIHCKNMNISVIIDYHIQLLYYLQDSYNILPSAYDSFFIDSKIHYMDILLNNNLCDSNTIILHYDLQNKRENYDLRSLITRQNIYKFFIEKSYKNKLFKVKTSFGGGNACVLDLNVDSKDFYMYLYDKVLEKFNNIFVKNITCNCLGKYYGLIIQPYNEYFDKHKYGEIRCFCHNGDIKFIIKSTKKNIKNLHDINFEPFVIHKSVYKNKIDRFLEDKDKHIEEWEFRKIKIARNTDGLTKATNEKNIRNIDFYTKELQKMSYEYIIDLNFKNDTFKNICYKILDELPEYIISSKFTDFGNILENSNIIKLCKQSFDILKQQLKLEGIHHRIDIINSIENQDKYVVNEIENINFGPYANDSIIYNGSILEKEIFGITEINSDVYKELITRPINTDYKKQKYNINGMVNFTYDNLQKIFLNWRDWDARRTLLSFT